MLWGIWEGKFWKSIKFELGDEKWELGIESWRF
jgi:hypothetical protein